MGYRIHLYYLWSCYTLCILVVGTTYLVLVASLSWYSLLLLLVLYIYLYWLPLYTYGLLYSTIYH